jgi:hypothetical protein
VVQDNDYAQWNAYGNQYWPADYLIDATGRVRYVHYGEGDYDGGEKAIQALLTEAGQTVGGIVSPPETQIDAKTPETYLGYDRARGFVSAVQPQADVAVDYHSGARPLASGEWNLDGTWSIAPQYVVPAGSGTLQLGFQAKNVYLVIEPGSGGSITVSVDGAPVADTPDVHGGTFSPRESRMYQVVALPMSGAHVLKLVVKGKIRLFAFTFG